MTEWWAADPIADAAPKPSLDPRSRELAIRTVLGEAANEPDEGMAGVAAVIRNRVQAGRWGADVPRVVTAKSQFEPWGTEEGRKRMYGYAPDSEPYKRAAAAVDRVWGEGFDPTDGATHFFSPTAQAALGRQPPKWAAGQEPLQIARHSFYAPEGRVRSTEMSAQSRQSSSDDWWKSDPPATSPSAPQPVSGSPPVEAESSPADTGGRFTDTAGENFRTAREGLSPVNQPGHAQLREAFATARRPNNDEVLNRAGGLREPLPNMLQKAIEPITSYPATYAQMNQEARDQMSEGVEQAQRGTAYDAAVGAGKVALGGIGYVASPINAALRTVVGKPIEENTGIPKEYTEFAASLALPVPKRAPSAKFAPEDAARVPTVEELKGAATAGFQGKAVKDLEVKSEAIKEFSFNLRTKLNESGLDDVLAPKVFGILSRLEKIPEGTAITGMNLQTIRRTMQNAAGSADKTERMAATRVIEAIDDLIPNIAARDILSGDPKKAAEAWALARGNYAAAMRSEDIAKAVLKAERQASAAGAGANIDNATRQQFKAILNNEKKLRGFDADEIAQMEQIVGGTKTGNVARLVGKAAPTGIVSGALSGGAGLAVGGPVGAVLVPIAGLIGKRVGDKSTAKQVAMLDEMVRSRAPLAKSMEDFGIKVQAVEQGRDARTMSAMVLSARNLVNNLRDAGVNLSPGELIRTFQGGSQKAAAENEQQ